MQLVQSMLRYRRFIPENRPFVFETNPFVQAHSAWDEDEEEEDP